MIEIIDKLYPEEGITGQIHSQQRQDGFLDIGLTPAHED
jgi:hypothetical protein